jgi:uncharacterized protein YcbK (DUF882 family)
MQITANQLTLIKSHPIDSSSANLPKDFAFFELKATESLDYNWIKPATNNHWLFELKSPVQGRFNWCAFKPHVSVDEKQTPLELLQSNINWNNPKAQISQFFTVKEVTKGDNRRIPPKEIEQAILRLAIELDKIRTDWGSPILVTSWYRPRQINRAVGGASNSTHIFGKAVDIRPVNSSSLFSFQSWLDENWFGALGYGAKRGFVHLDMRNGKGWKTGGSKGVRWNY